MNEEIFMAVYAAKYQINIKVPQLGGNLYCTPFYLTFTLS